MVGLDLPLFTWIVVIKNQNQAIKLILNSTLDWLNWIQNLVQAFRNSCFGVFFIQPDGISLRLDFILAIEKWTLFQIIDFKNVSEFDYVREKNWVGFANVYLDRCNKESDTGVEADIFIYKTLVKLDERLGTTPSEQLYECLRKTTRLDIIKVRIHLFNVDY